MTEPYVRKAFYIKICTEEEKVLACITCIKFHLKNKNVRISCSFTYDGNSIKTGMFRGIHCNSISTEKDDEIREEIRKLITKNPSVSCNEIMTETGCSGNKINQLYMSIKREVYKENSRKTS